MHRTKTIYILLLIWLIAIIAPPVISLVNSEERILISLNQTDEEQPEQGKKDNSEEKIVQEPGYGLSFALNNTITSFGHVPEGKLALSPLEIPSPPPENVS